MDTGNAEAFDTGAQDFTLFTQSTDDRNAGHGSSSDGGSEELQYAQPFIVEDYHKIRWKRLSKYYNDQYLDVFHESQQIVDVDEPLLISQFGSVVWTPLEKQQFFDALARKGRHDVPAIAAAIQSKSEVEVTQLLLKLRDAVTDRQRHSRYAKHVTHAEIDAADEVDEDLENLLEDAADALAAFQDYYDLSAVKNKRDGIWLIDSRTAAYVEAKCEAKENADPEGDLEVQFTLEKGKNTALGMFHVDKLLELSKDVFMNTLPHRDLDHWTEVAEDDEKPSITVDAVQSYYSLVKSLVQRLVQSAIFLAESRIRSTTTPDYAPARLLKDADVVAALSVLKMPVDSFEHWASFPRRSGVRVVLGAHEKGGSDAEALSLQQVENALAVRVARGRRRSLSSMVSMSSQDEGQEDAQPIVDRHAVESNHQRSHDDATERRQRMSSGDTLRNSGSSDEALSDSMFHNNDHSSTKAASNTDSSDDEPVEQEDESVHVSRKRRRLMFEEAQDEFLEKLDRSAQVKEAARLRQLLGFPDVEGSVEELGNQPKTLRKTEEELQDWTDVPYRSSWERKRSAQKAFDSSPDE